MSPWVTAGLVFFVYTGVAALAVPGLARPRRRWILAGSAAGLLLGAMAHLLPARPPTHVWLLPPVLLLAGYWVSGMLFAAPMPRVEGLFEAIDRALRIDGAAARVPPPLAELLEAAYVLVYPLIPAALAAQLLATPAPDPERFWTVILVTDFVCFAFLPWVQTRPPRAGRPRPPWRSRLRPFNLLLLGRTSIQANTFPSGHAAEALAATLLLAGAPWPILAAMAAATLLISAGAVLGRYHYAIDALAGWLVAAAVACIV